MGPVADPEVHQRKLMNYLFKGETRSCLLSLPKKVGTPRSGWWLPKASLERRGPVTAHPAQSRASPARRKCNRPPGRTLKQRHSHERFEMEASDGSGRPSARRVHLRALTSSTTWRETAQEAREGRQERSQQAGPLRTDETHSTRHVHTGGAPPPRGELCPAHVARDALH